TFGPSNLFHLPRYIFKKLKKLHACTPSNFPISFRDVVCVFHMFCKTSALPIVQGVRRCFYRLYNFCLHSLYKLMLFFYSLPHSIYGFFLLINVARFLSYVNDWRILQEPRTSLNNEQFRYVSFIIWCVFEYLYKRNSFAVSTRSNFLFTRWRALSIDFS